MALANIAALMSRWQRKVLVVDWDLEAPGIEKYFRQLPSLNRHGEEQTEAPGVLDLVEAHITGKALCWEDCVVEFRAFPHAEPLHVITAGKGASSEAYSSRLKEIDWDELLAREERGIGPMLDELRESWVQNYDFVLIDSRTGISDIGGICTIIFPDALVVFFTASEQSIEGSRFVMRRAREVQEGLPVERGRLVSVPVLARDESQAEYETSQGWRQRIVEQMSEFYDDWRHRDVTAEKVLQRLYLPNVPFWSFGERLPVVEREQEVHDPRSLGAAYHRVGRFLERYLDWDSVERERYPLELQETRALLADQRDRTDRAQRSCRRMWLLTVALVVALLCGGVGVGMRWLGSIARRQAEKKRQAHGLLLSASIVRDRADAIILANELAGGEGESVLPEPKEGAEALRKLLLEGGPILESIVRVRMGIRDWDISDSGELLVVTDTRGRVSVFRADGKAAAEVLCEEAGCAFFLHDDTVVVVEVQGKWIRRHDRRGGFRVLRKCGVDERILGVAFREDASGAFVSLEKGQLCVGWLGSGRIGNGDAGDALDQVWHRQRVCGRTPAVLLSGPLVGVVVLGDSFARSDGGGGRDWNLLESGEAALDLIADPRGELLGVLTSRKRFLLLKGNGTRLLEQDGVVAASFSKNGCLIGIVDEEGVRVLRRDEKQAFLRVRGDYGSHVSFGRSPRWLAVVGGNGVYRYDLGEPPTGPSAAERELLLFARDGRAIALLSGSRFVLETSETGGRPALEVYRTDVKDVFGGKFTWEELVGRLAEVCSACLSVRERMTFFRHSMDRAFAESERREARYGRSVETDQSMPGGRGAAATRPVLVRVRRSRGRPAQRRTAERHRAAGGGRGSLGACRGRPVLDCRSNGLVGSDRLLRLVPGDLVGRDPLRVAVGQEDQAAPELGLLSGLQAVVAEIALAGAAEKLSLRVEERHVVVEEHRHLGLVLHLDVGVDDSPVEELVEA
jgi:hypothetical protein